MNNEENVFDYMAAAEETGQRLDSLVRHVPDHIKSAVATALTNEWQKVTVFKDLSQATGKMNDAIAEVQESVAQLRRTVWTVAIVGIAVTAIIPAVAWLVGNR